MDRGAWWATIDEVTKRQTQLSDGAHVHSWETLNVFSHPGLSLDDQTALSLFAEKMT